MQKITGIVREALIKIVEYHEIGKVHFIRKPSVRNLKITIKPFKEIQVVLPGFVSMESADKFIHEKKTWIKQSQLRLARLEKKITIFDSDTQFSTRDHVLMLERHSRSTIRTEIRQGIIRVTYPEFADVLDPRIQKAIRNAIHQAWRVEAKKYLPGRLQEFADHHHLHFQRITVRDNKSRWGSCSRDNHINLSIHLVRLPQNLCDYVILHELAHTVYKHHQKSYWIFLDKLTAGKAKQLDKELNQYSPQVW